MNTREKLRVSPGEVVHRALRLLCIAAACICPACRFPANRPERPDNLAPALPTVGEALRAESGEPPAGEPSAGPLELTVEGAILLALENNRALIVERLNPAIRRMSEEEERAPFDPVLGAGISKQRTRSERLARTGSGTESVVSEVTDAAVKLEKRFPAGTSVSIEMSSTSTDSSLYSDQFASSRLGLTVNQALLKGLGLRPGLAGLRQARLDTLASEYELRGFAEALVAQAEHAYWAHGLAERQIEIFTESLALARQQLAETRERIAIGKLAEVELAAAQAEAALRREDLINAHSTLATSRLQLLRLVNPPGAGLWDREILVLDEPSVPDVHLDGVEAHVEVAMRLRPDLNQARLAVQRGELEIVKTRNGLLPRLDLFITLGKTGYADSFGRSAEELGGPPYDAAAGLVFEYPLGNRDARARYRRAALTHTQAVEAVNNLAQLVEVDVRAAYIEVNRASEQLAATAATRELQEAKLRSETEKFRVGRSTTLLVGQAQRDLASSRIAEIQAVVNYLDALVELHLMDGSLLTRRGISVPGGGL